MAGAAAVGVSAFPFSSSMIATAPEKRAAMPLDVLVVEDDASARRAIETAVRALGHDCRAAGDGDRAWSLLEQRRADVVIADWEMPGISGVIDA